MTFNYMMYDDVNDSSAEDVSVRPLPHIRCRRTFKAYMKRFVSAVDIVELSDALPSVVVASVKSNAY